MRSGTSTVVHVSRLRAGGYAFHENNFMGLRVSV